MHNTRSFQSFHKSPHRSIKHSSYFEVYDTLLSNYRGKPIVFVEIGVLDGGSLFMWRDFFGPQARIIGIDLNPNAQKWQAEGFEIFIGSQSDESLWNDIRSNVGQIDVLLDDGGHTYEQQIITTEQALPLIKDGGMLVVEDTHTSYLNGFGPRKYSFMKYVSTMMDRINQRSGSIRGEGEGRVWSVEVFESIVAFKINHAASRAEVTEVSNAKNDQIEKEYRYADMPVFAKVEMAYHSSHFLKRLPGSALMHGIVKHLWTRTKGARRIRSFFR